MLRLGTVYGLCNRCRDFFNSRFVQIVSLYKASFLGKEHCPPHRNDASVEAEHVYKCIMKELCAHPAWSHLITLRLPYWMEFVLVRLHGGQEVLF